MSELELEKAIQDSREYIEDTIYNGLVESERLELEFETAIQDSREYIENLIYSAN